LARTGQLLRAAQYRLVPLYGHRGQICHDVAQACTRWYMGLAGHEPDKPAAVFTASGIDNAPAEGLDWDRILQRKPSNDNYVEESRKAIPYLTRDLRDYRPGGQLAAALERLVVLCQDNGVEPILVGAPVTSAFRSCLTPEMEASYQGFLAQFCERHGCLFVDYYSALPDHLFVDYHHGTPDGGVLFSRQISEELLAPLLMGRQPTLSHRAAEIHQ
jgi:hypothetical protein